MKKSLKKLETIQRINPEIIKQEKIRRARNGLINFTTYTMKEYVVNWHHRNLANALDRLARKEIKRLMVFMPPRHGKSEMVSRRFPAYILGINPDAKIIGTSYSATLAESMSKDVQRIIDSPSYHELFPETALSGSPYADATKRRLGYIRTNERFDIVGHKGMYLSAGVGGGITGFGADFAIIDDPVKNRQEAESQRYRDMVFDWFTSTLYTRLEKGACVLLTLTRWHEDDLAGRLLKLAKDDPYADQWEVICYPAIYDERMTFIGNDDPRKHGEALWKGKYEEKQLRTIKATVGSYEWSALYQQMPSPPSGAIFQRDWFKFYRRVPSDLEEVIQSWDFTFKDTNTSDFVVGQVWGRKGADRYLLDQVRGRMNFTASINAIKTLSAKYPQARAKIIEDKANGPAVISTLKQQITGLIPFNPQGSKVERAYAVTPLFEAGNVYIPDPSIAPWVHDYIEELVTFPNGLNDDMVDSTSQGLLRLDKGKNKNTVKASVY